MVKLYWKTPGNFFKNFFIPTNKYEISLGEEKIGELEYWSNQITAKVRNNLWVFEPQGDFAGTTLIKQGHSNTPIGIYKNIPSQKLTLNKSQHLYFGRTGFWEISRFSWTERFGKEIVRFRRNIFFPNKGEVELFNNRITQKDLLLVSFGIFLSIKVRLYGSTN